MKIISEELSELLQRYAAYDAATIETVVKTGGFIIAQNVEVTNEELPPLVDGWALKATSLTAYRNVCNVFIVPTSYQTGTIWAAAQRRIALNAGLNYKQTILWARSRIPLKHRLLPYLVMLFNNPKYAKAHQEFRYDFTVSEYHEWISRHPIYDKLHPRQRNMLCQLWDEVSGVE